MGITVFMLPKAGHDCSQWTDAGLDISQ